MSHKRVVAKQNGLTHIEADGCVVNIRTGLRNTEGQPVTSIEVLPDNNAEERWFIPDSKTANIRVIKGE